MNIKLIVSFAAGAAAALAVNSMAQPSQRNAACDLDVLIQMEKLDKDMREHAIAEDHRLERIDAEVLDVLTTSQRSASILEVVLMPRH